MKKLITLLATAVLAVLPVLSTRAAQPESLGEARQTQEYKVRNFDGLSVSWIYKVELTRASRYSVSVDAPDFIIPYLRVEVRDGVLCLNPGSVSIPKAGSERSYMILENGTFTWKTLDGKEYHRL